MKVYMIGLALVVGLTSVGFATDADFSQELDAMKAQLQAQQESIQAQNAYIHSQDARISAQGAELSRIKGETWLTERRAEEVKMLINEVLSDAETRASLLDDGLTAGHNGHFFLASNDGNFLLNLSGQVQARYIVNDADGAERRTAGDRDYFGDGDGHEEDETATGFVLRRAKLRFDGHIFDPKLTYAVQINAIHLGSNKNDSTEIIGAKQDTAGGEMFLEDAWANYEFADGWSIKVGQFKSPFLREELVDSKYQLAIERSYVADYFTDDFTQGLQVSYNGEFADKLPIRVAGMVHDGAYMANTDYDQDVSDIAISARGEILIAGSFSQFDDFTSRSDDEIGLLLGAAVSYKNAENGTGVFSRDVTKATIDLSFEAAEYAGFNLFLAAIWQNVDKESSADSVDFDQFGFVVQGGFYLIPDKWEIFARYEFIDFDEGLYLVGSQRGGSEVADTLSADEDEISMVTIGTNYYFQGHASKVSLDIVFVDDQLPLGNSNSSVTYQDGDDDDQITVRAQYQLLF